MKSFIITLSILGAFSAQASADNKLQFEDTIAVKKIYMKNGISSNLLKNYQSILDKQFTISMSNEKLIAKK